MIGIFDRWMTIRSGSCHCGDPMLGHSYDHSPVEMTRRREITVAPVCAWYDLWVGFFWDRNKNQLYFLPLPCIGIVVDFDGP